MRCIIIFMLLFFGCKKKEHEHLSLKFLDEYILPDRLMVDGALVGGLSGIDYQNNTYYIACDDAGDPRFYTAKISLADSIISKVSIEKVVRIKDTSAYYDLESILFENGKILLTSEGLIREKKDPSFFAVDSEGNTLEAFELPSYYTASSDQKPRNNGVFEGLTRSVDNKGYWIITELPLTSDGIAPTADKAKSPVRMTYFNKATGAPQIQFAYQLDKIAKEPLGDFAVNGVTDLLAFTENKFLVIERSYSSGHGNQGNDIKIYEVDIEGATNTLDLPSLNDSDYIAVSKKELFNFESVRDKLTNSTIDNVEGICFGPKMKNGNQTLLLIVDNDFNKQGDRLNQLILMEVSE